MSISPEQSRLIETTWAAYINNPEPHVVKFDPPLNMRALAARLSILPIVLDMGGVMALRSSGEVVSFSWDEPDRLKIEGDVRVRNLVFFQAAIKFPELKPLVPDRPADVRECESCRGTGIVTGLPNNLVTDVICYCGGLGWLP